MKTKKLLFYFLAAVLGGCIPVMSLHPLHNEHDVVFEEKLLGVWVDDPNSPEIVWEFKHPDESKNEYELVFSDKEGNNGVFVAYLVKLKDKLFLDVRPDQFPSGKKEAEEMALPYNAFFFVPVHTFIRVDCIESLPAVKNCVPDDEEIDEDLLRRLSMDYDYVLKMRLTDDTSFKKLLERDPNAVEHELVNDTFVFTASTKELQTFALKYAEDGKVFSEEKVLIRKKTKAPQGPPKPDPNEGATKRDSND
ncbi:MAG: hypothetical protein ACYS21_00695 [Planctomycetota bacterium]|jgi:hypothetical protein